MTQEQLIRSIEQQLDNLSCLNEMTFNHWCEELYQDDDETKILEKWTPQTLYFLENAVEFYDVDPISS